MKSGDAFYPALMMVVSGALLVRRILRYKRAAEVAKARREKMSSNQFRWSYGVPCLVVGLILFGISRCEMPRDYWLYIPIAIFGPTCILSGIGTIIAGKDTRLKWAVNLPLLIIGACIGVAYFAGMSGQGNIVSPTVDKGFAMLTRERPAEDVVKHEITRPQLDAAIAAVNAKSKDISQRKLTVNKNDPQAMAKLQRDIEAYNSENQRVRAMYDQYMATVPNQVLSK